MGAVVVGFGGVILMMQAWRGESAPADVHWLILVLPMFSALTYALNQLMTRKTRRCQQSKRNGGLYSGDVHPRIARVLPRCWRWPLCPRRKQ